MVSGSSCAGGWLGLGDTTGFVLPHGRSFRVNHSKTVCLPDYPAGWGAARGLGEGALVSHRICLCDVLIESDRLWTSWTPAGLTSEAFSAASSLCHGWWEEDGNSSRRKVTQHLKRPFHVLPTTSCRTAHSQGRRSSPLYSLPEVSQKTFFCKPFYRELCLGYHHCSSSTSSSCLCQGSQPRHWGTEGQIRTSYPFHAKSRG